MVPVCLCPGKLRHSNHSSAVICVYKVNAACGREGTLGYLCPSVVNKPTSIEAWLTELGQPSADRDYQPGHERMQQLLAGLMLRHPPLRIRIAGTNGKGSTAFMLAAALQSAGLKVGLYTSPHILEFNERIRINGIPVEHDELLAGLSCIMPLAHRAAASYFETATALALAQFSQAAVDVEILEAGVGARLDATTAITADMALITPIALDHQNWLGETIADIAKEKSHVMQGCRFSISAPQCDDVAKELRAFNPDMLCCDRNSTWNDLSMPGLHQQINASLAWAAVQQLKPTISAIDLETARQAIVRCTVPGRLQHMRMGKADVWLDAAHNRHAVEALLPSLKKLADPFDAILVFTREDRSLADCMPMLKAYARVVISNHGSLEQADAALTPATALQAAINSNPEGKFLALGSFTTVAAILHSCPEMEPDDISEINGR